MSGVLSLAITVVLAVFWMFAVEPHLYFFGYFVPHQWNPVWGLAGLVAYIISFDTWFFWSHYALHNSNFLWNHIHYFHHQYKKPTAFAQFAVHPIEAALQGPVGHFCVQLWFPVHPVQLALMGFISSAWAFAAHDGRWMDFNSHTFHHTKGRGRKHYFNLGFLTPLWDILLNTRWHTAHPLWLSWQRNEADADHQDTRDGLPGGAPNDVFRAFEHEKSK